MDGPERAYGVALAVLSAAHLSQAGSKPGVGVHPSGTAEYFDRNLVAPLCWHAKLVEGRTHRGIDIGVHYTWLLAFVLIAWSLADGFFPRTLPGYGATTYWLLGICGALGLFASVLSHELSNSLVAITWGMSVSAPVAPLAWVGPPHEHRAADGRSHARRAEAT